MQSPPSESKITSSQMHPGLVWMFDDVWIIQSEPCRPLARKAKLPTMFSFPWRFQNYITDASLYTLSTADLISHLLVILPYLHLMNSQAVTKLSKNGWVGQARRSPNLLLINFIYIILFSVLNFEHWTILEAPKWSQGSGHSHCCMVEGSHDWLVCISTLWHFLITKEFARSKISESIYDMNKV